MSTFLEPKKIVSEFWRSYFEVLLVFAKMERAGRKLESVL